MAQLSASAVRELIDQHCDEFEAAWHRGERPQIHGLLQAVPDAARAELCGELVAVELELRARAGDLLDVDSYRQEFAEYAETVDRRFEEFRTWLRTTTAVDESVRSRIMSVEQDTEPQALETKQWPVADAKPDVAPDRVLSSAEAESGQTFGRYEVVSKLGQGGMGSVLLARDPLLDRQVALKLPHFQADDGPQVIERFYREARSMAAVHHPNLCPIFDVGDTDGHPYLTMAYIEGRSLAETIQPGEPMDASEAARLLRTIALAVQAIHEAGVVHRDLKPSNVMLDRRGQPLVTDFGLAARDQPGEAELTRSGAVIGSPAYMAPEQVRGQIDQIGPRTDVYALGVILYQMLCGRRPFEGTAASVFGMIESGAKPKPLTEVADVDRRLQTVCLKAMAHNVNDRFTSAAEFAAALEPFASGGSKRSVTRWPRKVAALAISAGLLLAIALYVASKKTDTARVDDVNPSSASGNRVNREEPNLPLVPKAIAPFTAEQAREYQEAWAQRLGASVEYENSVGMKLRLIPPGEFLMGAPDDDPDAKSHEKPQHRVRLTRPFWIGTTEVTIEQFAIFIEDTGYVTEAQADGQGAYAVGNGRLPAVTWDRRKDHAANPVQCVSWTDARRFCDWLSEKEGRQYRLPTEAEWEFACRAGTTERYFFGNDFDVSLAISFESEVNQLAPVGQYPANAFGLYDMHGNVHEICLDAGRDYTSKTVVDPVGSLTPEDCAVVRGGAISSRAASLRSSQRYLTDSRLGPGQCFATEVKGFRVVLLPDDDRAGRPEVALKDPAVNHSDLPLTKIFEGAAGPVESLALSGDGSVLVSGDCGGAVRIWDVESAAQRNLCEGLDQVKAVALSADRQLIAVGTRGAGISVIRTSDVQPVRILDEDARHTLGLDWSPDGRWLLSSNYVGSVIAWDMTQDGGSHRLSDNGGRVDSVQFSRDGKIALVANDQLGLSVWNVPEWSRRCEIADGYSVAAISPNGDRVATRGAVFDATSGEVVVRYDASQFPLEVAFAPDGRHIVSCETPFLLTIVEAATGQTVDRIEMNTSSMNALAISPDGKSVVTAGGHAYDSGAKAFVDSGDYTIRMWRLPESVWPKAQPSSAETGTDPDRPSSKKNEPVKLTPAEVHPPGAIFVNTTADVVDGDTSSVTKLIGEPGADGAISLREAIIATNNTAGDNTVAVDIDGVITLSIAGSDEDAAATGDLDITSSITIQGGGARKTIIDGGGIDRVFDVSASDVRVQFNDLTIRNGSASVGGGCHVHGANDAIEFNRVRVTGNRTNESAGAISIAGNDETMIVNIQDSLIDNNSSEGLNGGGAGGIVVYPGGTVSIVGTTISTNTGTSASGLTTQLSAGGSIVIVNSTITGNVSTFPTAGGVQKNGPPGTVTLTNSIVAGNVGGQFAGLADATIKSGGHNIIGPGHADFDTSDSDRVFNGPIDELLGPLTDNGGPTETHALVAGSPAIDAGGNAAAKRAGLTTDQRGVGFDRVVNDAVDIGAFEFGAAAGSTAR